MRHVAMGTDEVTARYLRQCEQEPDGLRTAVRDLALSPAFADSSGDRLLPRPLFVPERELSAFADDVIRLFDLITDLPSRLFDGDLDRYCAALRIDPRRAALMRSLGGCTPPLYGRADMYHDGTSFKLLEFNIASELGGVDRAGEIPRLLLQGKAFAAFAAAEHLSYVHSGERVAQSLRKAGAAVADGREPVVALLEGPGGMAAYGDDWRSFQEMMRDFDVDLRLGEVGEVVRRGSHLYLRGSRVDVVLRAFSVEDICAGPDGEELARPVLEAARAGGVVLWTPFESNLFSNKGCLAMLCDPVLRCRLTPEDSVLLDRVLPWTRAPGAGVLDPELADQFVARREELVLKPNGGYGGVGIVAGWESTEAEWLGALEQNAEHGCVVQQRVVPRPEPVVDPDTGATEPWQVAWGLFVTPDGYSGCYGRALPADRQALISVTASADTRIAGVFTTPG